MNIIIEGKRGEKLKRIWPRKWSIASSIKFNVSIEMHFLTDKNLYWQKIWRWKWKKCREYCVVASIKNLYAHALTQANTLEEKWKARVNHAYNYVCKTQWNEKKNKKRVHLIALLPFNRRFNRFSCWKHFRSILFPSDDPFFWQCEGCLIVFLTLLLLLLSSY